MKQRILLIVHQETSNPGRIGQLVEAFGYTPVICRHACGDPLPESLDDYAGAVMFGGPMSANDDHLPFIRAELDWLDIPLRENKPFLGICLGAQLLARKLGGAVGHHADGFHEIGFYPITASPAGRALFDDGQYFYQWHNEGFTLPPGVPGVEHLAASEMFPNQAFRTGNAYGLQFHPDVTDDMVMQWSIKVAHRMVMPGAQARDRQQAGLKAHGGQVETWTRRFFAHWLGRDRAVAEPMPIATPIAMAGGN